MQNLNRLRLRKYSREETAEIIRKATLTIVSLCTPVKVIAFGSSVTGSFDDASDLDFVVVFSSLEEALNGRRLLYRNGHLEGRIVDFICVDLKTFEAKSVLGGIYWVAVNEGRVSFPTHSKPPSGNL